jgi:hypothetical protein
MTRASWAAESAGAMKFRLSGDELTRLDERPSRCLLNGIPPLMNLRGGILLSCLKNIQGAPAKSRRSPLGQRVLMLFACVHHDITGADGLAKAIVVDHGLNAICVF